MGYEEAVRWMEARVADILAGRASEAIWLLEHPPALHGWHQRRMPRDLTDPDRFDVFQAQRGGQYTYHGPGQRVIYVLLDVGKARAGRAQVCAAIGRLGHPNPWLSSTSQARSAPAGSAYGSHGPTSRCTPAALWRRIKSPPSASACANGSAFMALPSMWSPISSISPALSPAASPRHGVTSLVDLGLPVTLADVDLALHRSFDAVFSPASRTVAPHSNQP